MLTESFSRHPWRSTGIAVALLVVLVVVLLNSPVAELVNRLAEYDVARRVLNKRFVLFVAASLAVALGAVALARFRRFRELAALLAVTAPLAALYGVYEFQTHYPNAAPFDAMRLGEAAEIVLGTDAPLSKYDPIPRLSLQRRPVERASFPAIDVHFHFESLPDSIDADRLVHGMDAAGIDKVVNLGGTAELFERFAKTFYAKYPDRFILFAKPNPGALQLPDGVERDLEFIKRAARMGARGLKENKSFGMGQRDANGNIVPIDDERLAPLWELAGRLGMPVLIHTADPPAFWDPVDVHNERYAELLENPAWSLYGRKVPSRQELMQQRERLLARHPGTNFIGAHLGMNPDDLAYAAYMFDTYPNYYVDMSSVVQELGREPYSARRFFIRYQDRILFGTDGGFGLTPDGHGWTPERMFRSYVEFLETDNEYIEYPLKDITKQGMWRIYGIDLPRDVLEKVYVKNAERLIPSQADVVRRLDELEQSGPATR
jgi:predicted TIM-barrel fold metal-dependent hydrolase